MKYSVAMTSAVAEELRAHLARADGQEDLCFAIWHPSEGSTRLTALVSQVILPKSGDREVHGNASFSPSYVDRAIDAALKAGGGIAFLHSHPALGWQDMSNDDIAAEQQLAVTAKTVTGQPLLGMTIAALDGTWSARFWEKCGPEKYRRVWAGSVREFGQVLTVHFADHLVKPPKHRDSQVRTATAWGEVTQAKIARLKVGVIGLGSVGSMIAEALARTGVQNILLLDYQPIEEVNLDRTLHASIEDVHAGRSKVEVVANSLRKSATAKNFCVEVLEYSVCEEEGFRRALDCDLLFSCVDRPWGRSVLNTIAYAHLIPVVDGGIRVSRTKRGLLEGADWKAHVVGPDHRCLMCLGQYDPGLVDADRRGDLENTSYLDTLPYDHLARANENVFGFSMGVASLEFMQFLMLTVGPLGLGPSGPQNYHAITGEIDLGGERCNKGCIFPAMTAVGDKENAGIAPHISAEQCRRKFETRRSAIGKSAKYQPAKRTRSFFARLFGIFSGR